MCSSKSFFTSNSYYGQGIGEVVVSSPQCTGAEDDIGQCKATWWPQTSNLGHDNDVGVNCDGSKSAIHLYMILISEFNTFLVFLSPGEIHLYMLWSGIIGYIFQIYFKIGIDLKLSDYGNLWFKVSKMIQYSPSLASQAVSILDIRTIQHIWLFDSILCPSSKEMGLLFFFKCEFIGLSVFDSIDQVATDH